MSRTRVIWADAGSTLHVLIGSDSEGFSAYSRRFGAKPGAWRVICDVAGLYSSSDAVVDDFGNLVGVRP